MSDHGGARKGAGRPEALFPRTMTTYRLADVTTERIERFAKARGLNCTQAVETMIEEYCLCLDRVILPGRWAPTSAQRPGLRSGKRPH